MKKLLLISSLILMWNISFCQGVQLEHRQMWFTPNDTTGFNTKLHFTASRWTFVSAIRRDSPYELLRIDYLKDYDIISIFGKKDDTTWGQVIKIYLKKNSITGTMNVK